ncbi:hypothetical protein SS50377_20334 [Spironucleus salmonicida]|uniref:Uncharacterized protein n=1 Tax=Spironucleus salmonicida TaxID=348837 RepID=V6LER0_9EUKA|nr:hypothetical protein SS50377_20334 [Spironucleus salmonicida]|eukprot:EST43015.1 hypothetical protein SS50377_17318 [Spironucleus salmonicida]
MLFNVQPVDSQNYFYFEISQTVSTEEATKTTLEMVNQLSFFISAKQLFLDLAAHGLMRSEEARGLEEIQSGEPTPGPHMDTQKYRCGHQPSEKAIELLREVAAKVDVLTQQHAQHNALSTMDFVNLLEFAKGTLIIAYPGGLAHDPLGQLFDQFEEYKLGKFNEANFFDVEAGAVFFANKTLISRGETLKCLNCSDNTTIKVIPSRSATYAPRGSDDQMKAEAMKYAFDRQKRLKEAELKTEDDVFSKEWADPSGMRRGFMGMGDVRFK